MTSVISPTLLARVNAVRAATSLANASQALRTGHSEPIKQPVPMIGIPEQNGPDSPDNPWFVGPGNPAIDPAAPGLTHARAAVGHLTASLRLAEYIRPDALRALEQAKSEADAGVHALMNPPAYARIDRNHVALQFDGAALWANLAINLLDLNPNDQRPPISIQPVDPITIQLPSPDADVQ